MAAEFTATAESTVTCPLCFEFFVSPNTPKDLACPHTCCQLCLQRMVTLNEPSQPIKCPMRCSKTTPLPAGGVSALRTNLHLKNLAEEHPNYVKGPRHTVPRWLQSVF
ncbi:RING finger protein 224-like [Amphiura filiformis]|uniref:RING finger protein 224-like n=1 Tax=Amphiura filiformis TaxID=82378 RepID=UPI003B215F9F